MKKREEVERVREKEIYSKIRTDESEREREREREM